MDHTKMKIAFVITKRGTRSFWNRCGVAFVNSDGSINVKLESVPVNGELQIRDYVPREQSEGTTLSGSSNGAEEDAYAA